MRRAFLAVFATTALVLGLPAAAPASILDDAGSILDDAGSILDDEPTSPNVSLVGAVPEATAISTEFASDAPIMYVSTLMGIRTYDISNPRVPQLLGVLPMAFFQNENVKLGEREDGTKFLLIGFDLFGVTPTEDPTNVGTFDEIVVVDVTDPADPHIAARLETNHWTHTVGCLNDGCTHAVTSGNANGFDVINLEDPGEPFIEATVGGQPMGPSPGITSSIGHDWDLDEAGVAWWVGTGGIIAYDVSDPTNPVILNSSDGHGTDPDWNNFITHNSLRPNAEEFDAEDEDEEEEQPSTGFPGKGQERGRAQPPPFAGQGAQSGSDDNGGADEKPIHVDEGNVLLVTEEDYDDPTCDTEGSFQTWHVPELDPDVNPEGQQGGGTITPLADWNTELLDSGIETPAGAFCSAHYFDYHQDGYVAQGWYQQGLRILDVNDATDIRQIGYWVTAVQETWGAYWVPEYDGDGRQTGDKTNLVYTNDPTRGLEILEVDLPAERGSAATVTAPILPQWLAGNPELQARSSGVFGGACLLPPQP